MEIRTAKLSDISRIRELTSQLQRENLTDSTGFVEYTILSEEDYKIMIQRNNYFYVLVINSIIEGFLICFDNEFFAKLDLSFDKLDKEIKSEKGKYVYAYLIGVAKKYWGQHFAEKLFERLFNDSKLKGFNVFWAGIARAPEWNHHSISLCVKMGFKLQREIKMYDCNFGIYKKKN